MKLFPLRAKTTRPDVRGKDDIMAFTKEEGKARRRHGSEGREEERRKETKGSKRGP